MLAFALLVIASLIQSVLGHGRLYMLTPRDTIAGGISISAAEVILLDLRL